MTAGDQHRPGRGSMTREGAPAKARRYLIEGRLVVELVDRARVVATCRGDGTLYRLGWDRGRWWCDCPARSDSCAHLVALRSVVAVDLEEGPT
jgi:hypothetical protein